MVAPESDSLQKSSSIPLLPQFPNYSQPSKMLVIPSPPFPCSTPPPPILSMLPPIVIPTQTKLPGESSIDETITPVVAAMPKTVLSTLASIANSTQCVTLQSRQSLTSKELFREALHPHPLSTRLNYLQMLPDKDTNTHGQPRSEQKCQSSPRSANDQMVFDKLPRRTLNCPMLVAAPEALEKESHAYKGVKNVGIEMIVITCEASLVKRSKEIPRRFDPGGVICHALTTDIFSIPDYPDSELINLTLPRRVNNLQSMSLKAKHPRASVIGNENVRLAPFKSTAALVSQYINPTLKILYPHIALFDILKAQQMLYNAQKVLHRSTETSLGPAIELTASASLKKTAHIRLELQNLGSNYFISMWVVDIEKGRNALIQGFDPGSVIGVASSIEVLLLSNFKSRGRSLVNLGICLIFGFYSTGSTWLLVVLFDVKSFWWWFSWVKNMESKLACCFKNSDASLTNPKVKVNDMSGRSKGWKVLFHTCSLLDATSSLIVDYTKMAFVENCVWLPGFRICQSLGDGTISLSLALALSMVFYATKFMNGTMDATKLSDHATVSEETYLEKQGTCCVDVQSFCLELFLVQGVDSVSFWAPVDVAILYMLVAYGDTIVEYDFSGRITNIMDYIGALTIKQFEVTSSHFHGNASNRHPVFLFLVVYPSTRIRDCATEITNCLLENLPSFWSGNFNLSNTLRARCF